MEYGLIGKSLKHSFSKEIHEEIGKYSYTIKELKEDELEEFMEKKDFKALNVTIPYKEKVLKYLDYISEDAKNIKAVNTIVNKDGKLYGYNTDCLGFEALIKYLKVDIAGKNILILGTGGTSKTVSYVLKNLKAKNILKASRKESDEYISYQDIKKYYDDIDIIINTTPCGMYPNNNEKIIDLSNFAKLEAVIDVIYNPLRTLLVLDGLSKNIKASGGLFMLIAQAFYAIEIFKSVRLDIAILNELYDKKVNDKENVVLIGMPSSGKSTVGKALSNKMRRDFYDVDEVIKDKIKMEISDYFQKYGEEEFRKIEEEVIFDLSRKTSCVIATGGGSILKESNVYNLKQNGKLFFLNRSLDLLSSTSSRPLSANIDDLRKRYNERYDKYITCSDEIINADSSIDDVIEKILEKRKEK